MSELDGIQSGTPDSFLVGSTTTGDLSLPDDTYSLEVGERYANRIFFLFAAIGILAA